MASKKLVLKRWRLAQEKKEPEQEKPESESEAGDAGEFRDLFGSNKWAKIPGDELAKNPKLLQEFFNEIQTAYAPLGGHLKFKTPQTLLNGDLIIYAVDVDQDPQSDAVVVMEKNPPGEKLLGIGHDDSSPGKQQSVQKTKELVNAPGHYAEVSGAMAHILLKAGAKPVLKEDAVRKVLQGKDLKWLGEHPEGKYPEAPGWYQRTIGGQLITKIMVGLPSGVKTARTAGLRGKATEPRHLVAGRKTYYSAMAWWGARSHDPFVEIVGTDPDKIDALIADAVDQAAEANHRRYEDRVRSDYGLLDDDPVYTTDAIDAAKDDIGFTSASEVYDLRALVDTRFLVAIEDEVARKGYAYLVEPQGMKKQSSTRIAKAAVWSEDEAFDLLLSFLGSSNDASVKIQDALSGLAEQEAEGEVALPPEAEAWRSFLKLAQKRVQACRGFLVGKMTELFGVGPEDVEEPEVLEETPELEEPEELLPAED